MPVPKPKHHQTAECPKKKEPASLAAVQLAWPTDQPHPRRKPAPSPRSKAETDAVANDSDLASPLQQTDPALQVQCSHKNKSRVRSPGDDEIESRLRVKGVLDRNDQQAILEIEEAMMKVYQKQRDQLGRLGSQDETAVRTLVRTQIKYAYEASPFFAGNMRDGQRAWAFLHALAKQLPPESAAFPERIENTTAKLPECSDSDSDYEEVPKEMAHKKKKVRPEYVVAMTKYSK